MSIYYAASNRPRIAISLSALLAVSNASMREIREDFARSAKFARRDKEAFDRLRERAERKDSLRARCGMPPLPEIHGGTTVVRFPRSSPKPRFAFYQGESW